MNLIQPATAGVSAAASARLGQPETLTATTHDVVLEARAQAALDAANTAKTTASTALTALIAQAERERAVVGTNARLVGAIEAKVADITRLEGEIEYWTRAVAGL
jgi:hypothetical protein